MLEDLRVELDGKLDQDKLYAVRSSANLEDGLHLSFAGQFQSDLNIKGVSEIINAIQLIWDNTTSPTVTHTLANIP